jgi:hypothetical protein
MGQIACVGEMNSEQNLVQKHERNEPLQRRGSRWEDKIQTVLKVGKRTDKADSVHVMKAYGVEQR